MQLPDPFPDEYFEAKGDKPVKIKPYNKRYQKIAEDYLKKINKILKPVGFKAVHKGATALGISGKGDIEFGVYPTEKQWDNVLVVLINYFKGIVGLNQGFAQFISKYKGEEVEVICIREGFYAEIDKKLFAYLKKNKNIVKRYEKIKNDSAYSSKEYAKAKDKFFIKIIKQIPD